MTTATHPTGRTARLLAQTKKGDDAFNARDFAAVDEVHHPESWFTNCSLSVSVSWPITAAA